MRVKEIPNEEILRQREFINIIAERNVGKNLTAFVDVNGLQIDGTVEEVNNPLPLDEKFAAFGWNVITIDAHNYDEIKSALEGAKTVKDKPTVVVAKSVKGKGVSYMENQASWHGSAPNEEQYNQAIIELDAKIKELEAQCNG